MLGRRGRCKSLGDVFNKTIERLKQKAFERYELPEWVLRRHKWVRLEDVLSILQQLKQNYVLVKIGDLEAIVYTSTKYEGLRDVVDDFCGNYDDVAREAYALGMKDLAKRLLKK